LKQLEQQGKPEEGGDKIDKLVKGQEDLAKSISELAKALTAEREAPSKPRTRKGRARLPSGGDMEFEMTES
jgi:hypothetical protein